MGYGGFPDVPLAGLPSTPPTPPQIDGDEKPTRVLVVEDHLVVAEGLAALINHQSDMKVVGSVGTVADCLAAAGELNPDVVLIDFRLPDGSGPDAAAASRSIRPAAQRTFLTPQHTDTATSAALQSRAPACTPH